MMTSIEAKIVQFIWRFDPKSILILLTYLGYDLDEILFCSHFTYSSQSRLIEQIEFQKNPKKVIITLNLGLLGGQSLLPDYFFKLVDNGTINAHKFIQFIGYFDDRLLRSLFFAIYPEFDETTFQSWEVRKRNALHTLRLNSTSTLHWLFQLVFPELQVRVEKCTLQKTFDLGSPILGKSHLGFQSILGKIKKVPVLGMRIRLITDEDSFNNKEPWPCEIERRFEKLIRPIFINSELHLEIWLIIRTQSTWLSLKPNSYLGYENIQGGDKFQFRQIRIFSGSLC
jgi:hypothetical protein